MNRWPSCALHASSSYWEKIKMLNFIFTHIQFDQKQSPKISKIWLKTSKLAQNLTIRCKKKLIAHIFPLHYNKRKKGNKHVQNNLCESDIFRPSFTCTLRLMNRPTCLNLNLKFEGFFKGKIQFFAFYIFFSI